MQYLLSVPENFASCRKKILPDTPERRYIAAADPKGSKIGSGGATAWLLQKEREERQAAGKSTGAESKRIIIHAGGQSRRLPSYAVWGKLLTPIPVFRWAMGQPITQTLLDVQSRLYEKLMALTGEHQNTLIASGDILVRTDELPETLPDADVVCFAMWTTPEKASRHGVFVVEKEKPEVLDCMLQKPSPSELEKIGQSRFFMMDIGIWILSDKALGVLEKKCKPLSKTSDGVPRFYDLYSDFGPAMGVNPVLKDADIARLTTAVVRLDKGEFYHYGTSAELISSTEKIQNLVTDQRAVWQKKVKTHPSIFVQNADIHIDWNSSHRNIWTENASVPKSWTIRENTIITGAPENKWTVDIPSNICVDFVPIQNEGKIDWCLRPYGMSDEFRGPCADEKTKWCSISLQTWFKRHGIKFEDTGIEGDTDIQAAPLFPVVQKDDIPSLLNWMIALKPEKTSGGESERAFALQWLNVKRLSADEIASRCDIPYLYKQRRDLCLKNLPVLARHYEKSVFYQSDLSVTARLYAENGIKLPSPLPQNADYISRMRDFMFRSRFAELTGKDGAKEKDKAFAVLRELIVQSAKPVMPRYDLYSDQIVWGRSPLRIDIAGGWSDTPPFCNINGGRVLNAAVDLNGQQSVQVYVRSIPETLIRLRSIDNGKSEDVRSYKSLAAFNQVGSVFSIPKAALCLCGFHPDFCTQSFTSLEEQLCAMGGGLEISLLAAIPKGSGMGTSSVLSAAVLGTLSNACSLNWDKSETANRVLVLEQLLTTGGGWQDQYGAVFGGLKLLESEGGMQNDISVGWLNEKLFTESDTAGCWLLYYTGITRTAKNILAEIVKSMFLNEQKTLDILQDIKHHASESALAFQSGSYEKAAAAVLRSWHLNKKLDSGTSTAEIERIISLIKDYAAGYKLPGAGGGGYMLICAKDTPAAARIVRTLEEHPVNNRARFVKLSLNTKGLEISRS
ncbi:bifunctional fucokinase/fucose-1-phosphate guanylyltransferase [Treponema sp. HNW]|uniref:bifunctional fucokinase/fucose-1-phosphate guanylyltransferase n=1 Tax=Treponema sp. HNW TaxID=3116654 RepID=UPI003D0F169E